MDTRPALAERARWVLLGREGAAKIETLTADDLFSGDGVFVASSVRELIRVHTLDGKELPDSTESHREVSAAYESVYR